MFGIGLMEILILGVILLIGVGVVLYFALRGSDETKGD
jgi:hypothetical protein